MDELRDALNKSFDSVAASEAAAAAPSTSGETGTPATPTPEPASATPATPLPVPAVPDDAGVPGDKPVTDIETGEVKDDKFGTEPKPTDAPGPKGPETFDHAPGTWGAEAREGWKDLKPRVRQEIWKREKDAVRALTISTRARKFAGDFEQMMQPYMGFIAAENAHPLQAVDYMMRTAAIFRTGSTQQKAELVANVIKQWGVDVEMVDDIMNGWKQNGWSATRGAQANEATDIKAAVRAELQPIIGHLTARQQAEEAAIDQEVSEDLQEFASKNEFFNEVREDMADLIEVAKKRGVKMSLTEAYRRATLHSESVQRVLSSRKTYTDAKASQTIADRARAASASVPGSTSASTTVAPGQDGGSLRDTIERVMQNAGS